MLARGSAAAGLGACVFGPAATGVLFEASPEPENAVGFEAVQVSDRPHPARDVTTLRRLRRLLVEMGVHVVHAHGMRAGALAALALRLAPAAPWPGGRRPALVVTVHNAPPPAAPAAAVYSLLERIVARHAYVVLCVSSDLTDDGRPMVLAVARLAPQKGLDTLIAAAARWRGRRPEPVLVIAGTGPLAGDLAAQARDLGVTARFLGRRDDVGDLLAVADVFALPSRWEGQPLVLQEAMRAGRPIVATDVGGVRDLAGDEGALLVKPDDPAALAASVRSVLDDPGLAARLSKAAAHRAAALPTETEAVDTVIELYRRLGSDRADYRSTLRRKR